MSHAGLRSRARAIAILVAAALAGCAVGPDFVPPSPPQADGFTRGGARSDATALAHGFDDAASTVSADLPADWWTLLGSPALDALVERALRRSPTLEAATATLAQAAELRRAGAGVFWPQVGASVSGGREKSVTEPGGSPRAVGPYGLSTLAASVGYSADVFGGHRRAVEALGAQVDRSRMDLEATRIALVANVANAAIARAGYEAQIGTLDELAAMQDEQIRLAQAQFDAGVASYGPVLALRSSRSTTAASLIALRDRVMQADALIARLCGDAPNDAAIPAVALSAFHLPASPPLELPAAWAAHRPDIVGAQADLHAASARIGVATAALLPDVTLTAQGGRAAGAFGSVLSAGVPFWSLEAAIAGTVFDGGANLHARRAAVDAYDAAAAQYRQTVLVALEQVADTLHALSDDRDALQARLDAASAADDALALIRAQWQAGRASYLDVLVADAQLRATRLDVAAAQAQRLQDAVALYVALGGGWWNRVQPASAQGGD